MMKNQYVKERKKKRLYSLRSLSLISWQTRLVRITNKRTDACSRYLMIWKINSGLLAVAWAGLWKKGLGWLWATLEARFLSLYGQKINSKFFWKYWRVRIEKLHRIKVNKSQNIFGKHFYGGKKPAFLSVNTWRYICSFICGPRIAECFASKCNPRIYI